MKKIHLLFAPLFFLIFSCASTGDLTPFYEAYISPANIPAASRLGDGKPLIYASNDIENDVLSFRSDRYYRVMGLCSFTGPKYNEDELKEGIEDLCEDTDSKVAIYTSQYKSTESSTYTSTQTQSHYNSYTRSYYTTSTSTPITSYYDRYSYKIYLLAPYSKQEIENWHLGLGVRDLTPDDRNQLKRNTGAFVVVVYNKYPAFYENLAYGDVIISLNGKTINDADDFLRFEQNLKPEDEVNAVFLRNGIEQNVTLKSK